jgi:hypothetical protein
MILRRLLVILPLVAAGILLWLALRDAGQALTGPQPVAWDRESCAQCRMLVSEPAYAAQIVQPDRALHFDDPGCLFEYLGAGAPTGELWFHHAKEDRWIAGAAVGFLPGAHTPMGFGLAAVEAGTPGAISLAEARRQAASRVAR